MLITGVRFKTAGKIYYFDKGGLALEQGMSVIVETARGVEFGTVEYVDRDISEAEIVPPLRKIVRIATSHDIDQEEKNRKREKDALVVCEEKIAAHALDMKLVGVELSFDLSKIIFYFTAEGRVDFRELVKELASIFRMRIELRQIGVRDEAKVLNGIGICGRSLCCASFLDEFHSVSIKMAKDQGLSLNPTKISGACARLMCCLKYEQDTYEYLTKNLPNVGDIISTPDGQAEVLSVSVLRGLVKAAVRKKGQDEVTVTVFSTDEVKVVETKRQSSESPKDAEKYKRMDRNLR